MTHNRFRTAVLIVHGVLALLLGLAFFYLRATMTNLLFEAVAVVIAILLAGAAFIVAAITDWFVAFSAGTKSIHRVSFYLLAGIALALAGALLILYPIIHMQWLVVFATLHALAFSITAFGFASKESHPLLERRAMYFFGTISVLFFGIMVGLFRILDDRSATAVLGAYLSFVGTKILFFAWNSHRMTARLDSRWLADGQDSSILPETLPPANAVKH